MKKKDLYRPRKKAKIVWPAFISTAAEWLILFIFAVVIVGAIFAGLRTTTRPARAQAAEIAITKEGVIATVNARLHDEGYKIYFRINEHGQIALVHPR